MKFCIKLIMFIAISVSLNAQVENLRFSNNVKPGAAIFSKYLPMLKGKAVAVFANQTSIIGNTHLVDTLLYFKVNIKKIFSPEHGFRGDADAGEKVKSSVDVKTGVPIVSLYGDHKKPTKEDLQDVDVMIFDIQDVGVRYYTYISSLEYYIEAAIEFDKTLIILDRPNPNGFYVDGPVLEKKFRSFVGMQPVPTVYGMTIGEYAKMLVGEKWLNDESNKKLIEQNKSKPNLDAQEFRLIIISCDNYTHKTLFELPVKPSPNIPDIQSIYWYPSTCLFEGTVFSEGRGTDKPFQKFGHPLLPNTMYSFVPQPTAGAKNSKHFFKTCYGWNLSGTKEEVLKRVNGSMQLSYIIKAYELFPQKDSFFIIPKSGKEEDYFFNKLAGNATLMKQLKQNKTEAEIKQSWQPALIEFKKLRKKYLLYPDFE